MHIAVLGATGIVGQKFLALSQRVSAWEVTELVASDRKCGMTYEHACQWQEPLTAMPEHIRTLRLCHAEDVQADVIVSFLPEKVAMELETFYLQQGKTVFSNASAYRMDPTVPILIPEINAHHLTLLAQQPFPGTMITNSNCCVAGVALALHPLMSLGLESVHVVTLQSISGSGYPGISAMDICGNTLPWIEGEERKICQETVKILGTPFYHAPLTLTVSVHRVPVTYGHMLTIHGIFRDPISIDDVYDAYQEKNHAYPGTYVFYASPLHPQVRKDLSHDDMRVHVGPITFGANHRTIKMNVLIHNLVRGAAGAVLANMEYYGVYGCQKSAKVSGSI